MVTKMKQKLMLIWILAVLIAPMFIDTASAQDTEATFAEGLTLHHSFENGTIEIDTFYKTDYVDGKWRITDNKNVDIHLNVTQQPVNTTILVEHMHADCAIYSNESDSQSVNGLIQDSMDDSFHGIQGGFYVSPEYEYNCVFAIEGYSEYLMNVWGFVCGSYGYISGNEKRLTESSLIKHGATGSKFSIVFDLVIQHEDEDYFHTISFMDAFVVNFDGMFADNTGGILEPDPPEPTYLPIEFLLIGTGIFAAIIIIAIIIMTR
jgi:hypothetical protein